MVRDVNVDLDVETGVHCGDQQSVTTAVCRRLPRITEGGIGIVSAVLAITIFNANGERP
jgi:hypothetical protein